MTTDIKELASGLRERAKHAAAEGNMTATCDARYFAQSANAIEALAGEVERLTSDVDALGENLEKVVAERDRLKAALVPFAKLETWRGAHDPAEGTMRMRVVTVPEIEAARKALGDAS